MELLLALIEIGLAFFIDQPVLLVVLGAAIVVTALASLSVHYFRRPACVLAETLMKGFVLAGASLLVLTVPATIVSCTFAPDAFCIFGAAPFLSGSAVMWLMGGVSYLVKVFQERKRKTRRRSIGSV